MSPDRTIRCRAVVSGRVQGVFFRDTVRRWALEHSVAGWVSNRSDGSVEAVLEGSEDRVDRVLGLMEQGPPNAVVADIEVSHENPSGMEGFQIR